MGVRIHHPPRRVALPEHTPLVFLAGPIQGAQDWQQQAVEQLNDEWSSPSALHIANPRRPGATRADFDTQEKYRRQTRWERDHIFRAAEVGANVIWLAQHDLSLDYPEGRPFGQTTRFESGMVYAMRRLGFPVHISIGMDPTYQGSRKYYEDLADELSLPIYDLLENAISDAIEHLETVKT